MAHRNPARRRAATHQYCSAHISRETFKDNKPGAIGDLDDLEAACSFTARSHQRRSKLRGKISDSIDPSPGIASHQHPHDYVAH